MSHSIGWLVARCRYFREQTPPWTPPCGSVSHSRPAFIIRVLFVSPCTKKKAVRFEECVRASTKSYGIFTTEKKKVCNFKRKGMDDKMFVCAVDIRNACPDIHLFLFGKKRSSNEHAWLHAKSTCRANGDRGLGDSIARVSICTLSPIRIWPCSLYWKNIKYN